ncbi:DNA polymerase alpha accessory factor Mcl1, partial [Elasticomyces elasticus]
MPDRPPVAPRPAQPPGKTSLSFTRDGAQLLVAGCANYARSFRTSSIDDEPDMIDHIHDDTLALVCGNDYIILGAEDGTVCEYAMSSSRKWELKEILVRFSLPVRSIALSEDENWIAVSSDEVEIKVVNRHDIENIHTLKGHPKPTKHLSYNRHSSYLAASCTDGKIYLYDMASATEPRLHKTIEGIIQRLETVDEVTSACYWHPYNTKLFACGTASREIVLVDTGSGEIQKRFPGAHNGPISSISWSPNGNLLASSSHEGSLIIWNTVTGQILQQNTYEKILEVTWHNKENLLCWTNSWGEAYIIPDFLKKAEHIDLLNAAPQAVVPSKQDQRPPQSNQQNGSISKPLVNGHSRPRARSHTPDSLDELLGDT